MTGSTIGRAIVVTIGAIFLTVVSFQYRYPSNCDDICYGTNCIRGTCEFGEQQAGFPRFMVRDSVGSSPTSGWGKIDSSDFLGLQPGNFILNLAFYGALLWILGSVVQLVRDRQSVVNPTTSVGIPALIMVLIAFPTVMDMALRPAPTVSTRPQDRVVGYWETADNPTNPLLLLFNETGGIGVFIPKLSSGPVGYGSYEIGADNTFRVTIESTWDNFCTMLPSVFDPRCTAIVATPTPSPTVIPSNAVYPAPEDTSPSVGYPAPPIPTSIYEGYPAPTAIAITYSSITATFTMTVSEDTLILTNEAGASHTFRRRE